MAFRPCAYCPNLKHGIHIKSVPTFSGRFDFIHMIDLQTGLRKTTSNPILKSSKYTHMVIPTGKPQTPILTDLNGGVENVEYEAAQYKA